MNSGVKHEVWQCDGGSLLNTSFKENEPIVNTPQQALECFLRTQMDVLLMGPFLPTK
jgi:carbamoyltransferase